MKVSTNTNLHRYVYSCGRDVNTSLKFLIIVQCVVLTLTVVLRLVNGIH
jgi:hypothetical protein